MTSSDIFDAVAAKVDVPRELINDICLSWSRDIYSLYSKRTVRCIVMHDLGYMHFKIFKSMNMLGLIIAELEQTFEQYKPDLNIANERVREIVTLKVDTFLIHISHVLQNVYYAADTKRGNNKKVVYDFEKIDGYMQRFYRLLDNLPCQLKRKEPSEIQKKVMRSLLQSKAYIDLPEYLDCPMWPVRMHYKTKNSLYGLSVSAIILERNKIIEHKRQKGRETLEKHKSKTK